MKTAADRKDGIMWIRINSDSLKAFDNLARSKDISRSEYIRQLMEQAVKRAEE